jgi:hypothetical protein
LNSLAHEARDAQALQGYLKQVPVYVFISSLKVKKASKNRLFVLLALLHGMSEGKKLVHR